jgi:signal transduction histidine kinase
LASFKGDARLQRRLEEILMAGERAAEVTAQLLAFSRQQVLEARILDLNEVVEAMRSMLGHLMGDNIKVLIDLYCQSLPVFANFHQLEQVLLNLAVNARDAMPHGGQLTIATKVVRWGQSEASGHIDGRPGEYALLSVADTGVGIDEVNRQRIFEPFFTTKEVARGTGLGLAMVQGIVAQSSGYVEVITKLSQGTEFKIYLPLRSGDKIQGEEGAPSASLSANANQIGGGIILVVEDRLDVLQYVTEVLKTYGYHVIGASNAEEALKLSQAESTHIDLVLADAVMPGMSGVDLVVLGST